MSGGGRARIEGWRGVGRAARHCRGSGGVHMSVCREAQG